MECQKFPKFTPGNKSMRKFLKQRADHVARYWKRRIRCFVTQISNEVFEFRVPSRKRSFCVKMYVHWRGIVLLLKVFCEE